MNVVSISIGSLAAKGVEVLARGGAGKVKLPRQTRL